VEDLQEKLQENLITYLDGMPEEFIDKVCQIVVDTINENH
jgi:hypothetical protein